MPGQASASQRSRDLQVLVIWVVALLIQLVSFGRDFGTDIDNYVDYLKALDSISTANSLEPIYIFLGRICLDIGLGRTAVIELTALASIMLIAVFCSRQRNPLATLVIVLGWMLLQQIWGTIRMGLGVCLLLFANEIYIRRGRIPWWTLAAPVFHWSLLVHPFTLLLRWRARTAVVLSILTYAVVATTGSIRTLFFAIVPDQMAAVANYAALQGESVATIPSPLALLIHLMLVYALTKTCSQEELPRFLGPLTLLYCATCLFFDFDQAGGRVANILISMKLLALIKVYDEAERLSSRALLVRSAILAYCCLVALQYYIANAEYF
nr:EpsG family protein [Rubrivivax gelatinosus]